MRINWGMLVLGCSTLGLLLTCAGCALDSGQGEPLDEPISVANEAVVPPSPPIVEGWAHGPFSTKGSLTLDPVATHLCLLTRVQGQFRSGANAAARLWDSGGNWVLSVAGGVQADAYCFRRRDFERDSDATTLSADVRAVSGTPGALLGKEAFSFLSGIQGEFYRTGDQVRASQASLSSLGRVTAVGNVAGYGRAFAVGTLAGRIARFFQADGSISTNTYEFGLKKAPPGVHPQQPLATPLTTDMAPTALAACGFSELRGGMWSPKMYWAIEPVTVGGVSTWQLSTNSPLATSFARCYARNQVP